MIPSQPPITMASTESRTVRKVPVRLMSITSCQCSRRILRTTLPLSRSVVTTVPSRMIPAEGITILSRPNALTVCETNRAWSASFTTLPWTPMASPPAARMPFTTRSICSGMMSQMAIFAPIFASSLAQHSPIPLAPPVIRATAPFICMVDAFSSLDRLHPVGFIQSSLVGHDRQLSRFHLLCVTAFSQHFSFLYVNFESKRI